MNKGDRIKQTFTRPKTKKTDTTGYQIKTAQWVHYLVLAVLGVIIVFTILNILWPHLLWHPSNFTDYPLHSTVESLGAIAAILIAFMPLQILFDKNRPSFVFLSTGFLVMGLLDLFHSFYQVGHGFVFTHAMALLAGGFFFALFVFPWKSVRLENSKNYFLFWGGLITVLLVTLASLNREFIPEMIHDGVFTSTAKNINLIAGILFLVGAVKLTVIYIREKILGVLILVFVAVVSAIVGLKFQYSTAWSDSWWLWHFFRLTAFLALLGYILWRIQAVSDERIEVLANLKEKHSQLLASEELFRLVNKATRHGLWDWNVPENEVYFSPVWKMQVGYKDDELENDFGNWVKLLHPDDKERCLKAVDDYIKNPEGNFIIEFRFQHKDGHFIWIHNQAASVKDKDGNVLRMFGAHTDITAQKEAEKKRRESDKQFQIIFENSPLGKSRTGLDGSLNINKAFSEITGYNETELQEKNWKEITHPDDIKESEEIVNLLIAGKRESVKFEKRYLHKKGHYIWTEVNTSLHRNEDAEPQFFITTISDITYRKEAEERLEKEKEFTDAVINAMPGVFYLFDENGKFLKWNKTMEELSGITSEEMAKKSPLDVIAPHHHDKVGKAIQTAFETGDVLVEADFNSQGKAAIPYLFSGKIIQPEGKPLLVGIGIDITKRKQAEKEKEKALHELNERIKEMNCLFEINEAIKNPEVNIAAVMEKITRSIPKGWQYPEKTAVKVVLDGQTYQSAKFTDSKNYLQESILVQNKERGYIKVTVFNLDKQQSGAPFLKEEGELLKTIAGNISIYVQRVESEREVRESEQNFRSVFSNSPVSIWQEDWTEIIEMIDALKKEGVKDFKKYFEQNRQFVNEALTKVIINDVNQATLEMFEAESKDDLVKSLEVVFATEDTLPGFIGELIALAEGKQVYKTEMKLNTAKGDLLNTMLRMSFPSAAVQDGQVLVSIMDITDLKIAQEQLKVYMENLQRSNKELERFAYVASHDLQEPLRMVSSYTQLLERRYKGQLDERADKYIHYAVDGANRMQNLINDLLDFSRISTRGEKFSRTDINDAVKNTLNNLETRIDDTGAQIKTAEMPVVKADSGQIERLFLNLIGNALKFSKPDEKPIIEIDVKEQEDKWLFSIKDNGIGIDEKFKEKVFVIFQRLHGASQYKGTGIGLAICKRIVQRHEGEIWFESEENKGTTFFFTLKKYKLDNNKN